MQRCDRHPRAARWWTALGVPGAAARVAWRRKIAV